MTMMSFGVDGAVLVMGTGDLGWVVVEVVSGSNLAGDLVCRLVVVVVERKEGRGW